MKKVYLAIAVAVTVLSVNAQCIRQIENPMFSLYTNDTLSVQCTRIADFTTSNVFGDDPAFDSTSDGICFAIHHHSYIVYLPKTHTKFTVKSRNGARYSVSNHLTQLIGEIRKNKKELMYMAMY